ncbi:unnamed protein product [Urochloa humidicola]
MAEDPLWPCHSSPPLRPRCCSQRKWSRLTAPRAKISTGSSPCSYLPEAPLVFSRARLVYRFYQDASDLTRRASAVGMEFITTMEMPSSSRNVMWWSLQSLNLRWSRGGSSATVVFGKRFSKTIAYLMEHHTQPDLGFYTIQEN